MSSGPTPASTSGCTTWTFGASHIPPPQLRITFDWGDAPVPDSYAGPTLEFSFEDVRIIRWEEALNEEEDRDHRGQVAAFDYFNGVFTLTTFTLSLSFAAVTCRVESLE